MDRFTRGERLTLAVAIAVAAVAAVFAWTNFTRAFPEAHLSFAVNRSTSQPVAEAFLREHAPAASAALADRRPRRSSRSRTAPRSTSSAS